jgi:glutathione S-transferase
MEIMKPAKLHYFKGRGRAETTRWMLAINNIDFINISLEDYNDFDNLKTSGKLPFNQLPLLELDDLKLSQSNAMISFLARRGDLYGKTNEDAVRCDMLVGAVGDFNVPAMQFAFKADKDEASRDLENSLKKFGKHFEHTCYTLFKSSSTPQRCLTACRCSQCKRGLIFCMLLGVNLL